MSSHLRVLFQDGQQAHLGGGFHFCLFGCIDSAEEEAAIKDKPKGHFWNEDSGESPYARVKGKNSCSLCSPTGTVQAGGPGMGPWSRKGATGVSH